MKVYMDNNATTAMTQEVVDAMLPYFIDTFGNASSKFYEAEASCVHCHYYL